jgi:menaquinol-cytochrome c reductase iron-sulfur subunit
MDDRRPLPGAFEGETVTRRRFMTLGAHSAGAIATAAITIPVLGFAVGPIFRRLPVMWQPVAKLEDVPLDTYMSATIRLTPDNIGEANLSTVFLRRRDPKIDTEPIDRFSHFIALSSRCAHVGCPVGYHDAARSFVCPCHGGVYDFQGKRIGGPPVRPLDHFQTRVRNGQVELGPRYSVTSQLEPVRARDPGEFTGGIWEYLYPPRPSTFPPPSG